MYYSAAIRALLIRLRERLVEQKLLQQADNIFFLTIADRTDLVAGSTQGWNAVIAAQRTEREHHLMVKVPDTIRDWTAASQQAATPDQTDGDCLLSSMPISVGTVTGLVRLIRSVSDWSKVIPREILVVSVIDPDSASSSASQDGRSQKWAASFRTERSLLGNMDCRQSQMWSRPWYDFLMGCRLPSTPDPGPFV